MVLQKSSVYCINLYRIQTLEREKNNHLFNKRSEFRSVFCGLEEIDLKFALDRRNESKMEITPIVSILECKIYVALAVFPYNHSSWSARLLYYHKVV